MNLRHFFILALMIIGIAYLQWLMTPPPAAVRPAPMAEEAWKTPDQPEFDAKAARAQLNSAGLWGKLADSALAAPLNDPEWRFLGAMARGQERYVIIKIENQPEQKLAPGDTLPGGSQILAIENDRLCLLLNGQKRSLSIYPQGPLSGNMPGQAEGRAASVEQSKPGKRRK